MADGTAADADAKAGSGGGASEGEGQSKLAPSTLADRSKGYWPPWHAKFRNDFRSAREAKANDGLLAPVIEAPEWADDDSAATATILEAARRRHDQAAERSAFAEQRASRLLQTALTLLALAFVVAGFEASRLRDADAPAWVFAVVLAVDAAAIGMLGLAIIQAQSVDRVGYAQPASPNSAATLNDEKLQQRELAVQEAMAAQMANWTGRHKVNEFLQARAWFTRGVVALAASGLIACIVWQFAVPPKPADPVVHVDISSDPNASTTTAPPAALAPTTSASTTPSTSPGSTADPGP